MNKKAVAAALVLVLGGLSLYGGLGGFDKNTPTSETEPTDSGTAVAELSEKTPAHEGDASAQRMRVPGSGRVVTDGTNPANAVPARPTPKPSQQAMLDPAFEDWIWQYGYDLAAADVMMYLRSPDMPPARRARLLEFAIGELPEVANYFASKEGQEFLESLLSDKGTDDLLATRVGHTLRWINRERTSEANEEYVQRFAQAKTTQEKVGLVSATSDGQFLRETAFNHREATSVRAMAINNLLSVQKDDKTLKQLLDLTETQPELTRTVLQASANNANTLDEFMNVVETLRREGVATPDNARYLGETFARGIHPSWLWAAETPTDPFVKQILQAYQSQSRTSSRNFSTP